MGAILGARLLYLLTIAPALIRNAAYLKAHPSELYQVISNGMVFYGGLFGAVFVLHRYCRRYALNEALMFDYLAPLFPLFHAFGRVGCFLTGCCHGVVSERFGIAFVNSTSAPNGVPFFPIQLVCSLGNLLLCVFLFSYERRHHAEGKTMRLYFLLYAAGRFVIEFFRGDSVRGVVAGLSVSQWLSLLLIAVVLLRRHRGRMKTERSS